MILYWITNFQYFNRLSNLRVSALLRLCITSYEICKDGQRIIDIVANLLWADFQSVHWNHDTIHENSWDKSFVTSVQNIWLHLSINFNGIRNFKLVINLKCSSLFHRILQTKSRGGNICKKNFKDHISMNFLSLWTYKDIVLIIFPLIPH